MSQNNFTDKRNTSSRSVRLFVMYKSEFAAMHGAWKGNSGWFKIINPFMKKGQEDVDGLILRIVDNQRGHYLFVWLWNNNAGGGYSDVLRAWDERGFELHPDDVKKLNARRRNNINRKNRDRNA